MLTPLIGLGWTEVLVIAGVVFVLFGAARIPTMFRSLGEGINSFKEGLEGKESKSKGGDAKASESRPQPSADETSEAATEKS